MNERGKDALPADNPEIDVDQLMVEIRAELDGDSPSGPRPASRTLDSAELPRLSEGRHLDELRNNWRLADLLAFHDKDFVHNAYSAVLGREPDAEGLAHYLGRLREGRLDKVEILGRLRLSAEGRARAVRVGGLYPRLVLRSLFRVPVAGYLLELVYLALRLPKIHRNIQVFETYTNRLDRNRAERTNEVLSQLERTLNTLQESILEIDAQKAGLFELEAVKSQLAAKAGQDALAQLEQHINETFAPNVTAEGLSQETEDLRQALARLERYINETFAPNATTEGLSHETEQLRKRTDQNERIIGDHEQRLVDQRRQLLDQQMRLGKLLEQASEAGEPREVRQVVEEQSGLLDAFYVSLEDHFRGARADIKGRFAQYLPLVEGLREGVKNAGMLDIGCGRGEWIELLGEHGIKAKGLDVNPVMVRECREMGLDAEEGEVLDYLREFEDDTLGGVFGFHIIEHLPLVELVTLFDEARRVLKPGGIAIFETPNPENIFVGACNFYYDPTHRNPLPPGLTQFMVQSRGFVDVAIDRLNADLIPNPFESDEIGSMALDDAVKTVTAFLSSHFYAAPDYAVIGYKPE